MARTEETTVERVDEIDPDSPAALLARARVARCATSEDDTALLLAMLGLDGKPMLPARTRNHEWPSAPLNPPAAARLTSWQSPEWMDRAACGGSPVPEDWHPVSDKDLAEDARRVCAGCPVLGECGEYAVAERISDGIWAGHRLDVIDERKALRDKHNRTSPRKELTCAQCGAEFRDRQAKSRCRACMLGLEPAADARASLLAWRALGVPWAELSAATGVPTSALQSIANGGTLNTTPENNKAILSITGIGSAVPA